MKQTKKSVVEEDRRKYVENMSARTELDRTLNGIMSTLREYTSIFGIM